MTLHGTALWLHIVLAIVLVGGSAWTHLATIRLRRSRTVDEARAHAATVQGFVTASLPLAVGTLAAGAYLATVGSYWTTPWLVVSLVLFAVVGALSGSQVDPAITRLVATLDGAAPGPLPADAIAQAHARGLATVPAVFGGIDLAIVFLMSNKPVGWAGALATAAVGVTIGLVLAARERHPALATA